MRSVLKEPKLLVFLERLSVLTLDGNDLGTIYSLLFKVTINMNLQVIISRKNIVIFDYMFVIFNLAVGEMLPVGHQKIPKDGLEPGRILFWSFSHLLQ